jgi:hypothetical protein
MGRLDKLKREAINEANIRVLNEGGTPWDFIQKVDKAITSEPYFKQMINDYDLEMIEQLYIIVNKIKPNDSKNYQDYRIEYPGGTPTNKDHYIVRDKNGKEIYSEKKQQ